MMNPLKILLIKRMKSLMLGRKKSHRQISLQIIAGKVKTQKKVRNLKEV